MIERHQDYILTVASVPTGGVQQVPLKLDTDAPFALRLVRSRNIGLDGWKITTPTGAYQSNALRTDLIVPTQPGNIGYSSRGSIIYEEMIYLPGSTINVDIGNSTGEPLTNAQLLFRGSKLFADDSYQVPVYPERMAVLPAVYQVVVSNVGANGVAGRVLNNQLTIKNDADFVYRYGACDAFVINGPSDAVPTPEQYQFTNLYVQIRDENGKYYSNAPVHVNDLFGQGLPTPFQTATANDDQVLFTPGLVTPEIYLPRKANLYFDVIRSDADGVPVNLYFRFGGMKVFQR